MYNLVRVKKANADSEKNELKNKVTEYLAEKIPQIEALLVLKGHAKSKATIDIFTDISEREQVLALLQEGINIELRNRARKINEIYNNLETKPSVQNFSYLLQKFTKNATKENINSYIENAKIVTTDNKSGLEKITEAVQECARQLEPGGNVGGLWEQLIRGKYDTKQLKSKGIHRQIINAGIDPSEIEATFNLSITKQAILEASWFNPTRYPLKDEIYWPYRTEIIDSRGLKSIPDDVLEKIKETIPLIPGNEESLESEIPETVYRCAKRQSSYNTRLLELVKKFGVSDVDVLPGGALPQPIEAFMNFLERAWSKTNPDYSGITEEIAKIKTKTIELFESGDKRVSYNIIPDYPILFDSIAEKNIVELINKHFNLSCVQSRITFPIPSDCPVNIGDFEVDFIIYCDTLENKNEVQAGQEVEPKIKKQVLLVGEYYGFDRPSPQVLTRNLTRPNGEIFTVKRGNEIIEAKAGVELTVGEIYGLKTIWKKITEDVAAKTLGYGTIAIESAKSDRQIIQNIRDGLNANNVIFYEEGDAAGERSEAAKLLRGNPFQTKNDIYEALIQASIAKIKAHLFSVEIKRNKREESTQWSGAAITRNRENVLKSLREIMEDRLSRDLRRDADNRINALENLYISIQNTPKPSSEKIVNYVIQITNFAEKEIPSVFDIIKTAYTKLFNLMKFGK